MTVTIHDALKKVSRPKEIYFKFKFPDLYFKKNKKEKTQEAMLRDAGRTTMDSFLRWEQTDEYKELVALYLKTKMANDFLEIYYSVSEKAKQGDDKAVRLFLTLRADVDMMAKYASNFFESVDGDEENEDDELVIY